MEAAPAASPSAASRSRPPASMKYFTACSKVHLPVCRFTSTPMRAARYRDKRKIWPGAHQHFLAIQCPSLHENAVLVLATSFIAHVIGNRKLEKMPGNAFVPQNRARILDGGADIKIFRVGIVSGNEEES